MGKQVGVSLVNVLIGLLIVVSIGVAAYVVFRADFTGEQRRGVGRELIYDDGDLRKVDPRLIRYEQRANIPTGLESARALAVGPGDRIYVAGAGSVRVFGRDGKSVAEFQTAGEPGCLAVGRDGTVYLGMADHVEVYSADGRRQATWPSLGPNARLTSIAVSGSDVFAADGGGCVVVRYDASGRLIGRIGGEGPERGGGQRFLLRDTRYFDVAVAPDGTLWVANPGYFRLEARTFDGKLKSWWGEGSPKIEGFFGCCNPAHFALMPGGGFVTLEKGMWRVKTYSAEGAFAAVVAPPEDFDLATEALDLAVDSKGRVLILDPQANQVRIYGRKENGDRREKGDA